MTVVSNRPDVNALKARIGSAVGQTGAPVIDLSAWTEDDLQDLLDSSIAWVEDVCSTAFDPVRIPLGDQDSLYDGNGTNQVTLRKKPALSAQIVQVETPILGFIRVYKPEEIKLYRKQGVLKIFTYKLAVEQALLNTLDYQAWGVIFPPLPQCVKIAYTYGYPAFDPDANANVGATSFDAGLTWQVGDLRNPEENNWLRNLQQAAVVDAAASFLAQMGSLRVGVIQAVSFDGYSRSMSPSPYVTAVQHLTERRDELLKRRRRLFHMATAG